MARQFVIVVTVDAESQPMEHRVAGLPVTIGRDASNDVQVASQFVSSFHAKVEEIKGRVFVRDLGSRNGTQVCTADGTKTRVAAQAVYDLAQCNEEFFLGSSVRVQVVDPERGGLPWHAGRGPARREVDSFLDLPDRGPGQGRGAGPSDLPDLGGRGWNPGPRRDAGDGPVSLPDIPGERLNREGRRSPDPLDGSFGGGGGFGKNIEQPREIGHSQDGRGYGQGRGGFEPIGGGRDNLPHKNPHPHLATGNFQLSIEGLALQGLRELVGSLMPGHTLQTQGDVARLITRLHDAVEVLSRTLIPLRQSYLKFVSSMDLAKSAHSAHAGAMLDMAREPTAVAAALLDFREHAPEASKALETALKDITTHQVAMLDGVMQGVRALLEELSPNAVSEAAEGKRGGLRLGGRQRDVWEEYCERYERVSDESEAFSRIFGEEFAQAYRRYRQRSR